MSFHLKAGLVVVAMAWLFFSLAKPLFLQFMMEDDFRRRRNAWLTLNAAAFVSPSVWIYFGVLAAVLVYMRHREKNPAALYLFLLLAMAPYHVPIPTFGLVGQVFGLDHFRVLGIALIVPWLIQKRTRMSGKVPTAIHVVDVAIGVFCALQILLILPYTSVTDSMRKTIILLLDVVAPYYFLSRAVTSTAQLREAMASLSLGIMVLAPIAIFEMSTRIMLWGSLQEVWGASMLYVLLLRDGLLRAQTTAGHSIVFGFACSIALIFWLALLEGVRGRTWRWGGTLLLVAALLASFSRGPWLGAVAGALVLLMAAPIHAARAFKVVGATAVMGLVVLLSPIGERLLDYLPFIGEGDSGTVTYRQLLLKISLELIAQDPLTGNPYFLSYMEELRQGQGIIDLVNGIVTIALAHGVITLAAYLLAHGTIVWAGLIGLRQEAAGLRWLGAGLAGALFAGLTMLFTASNYLSIPYLILSCTALGVALLRVRAIGIVASAESSSEDTRTQAGQPERPRRRAAWGRVAR